LSHIGIVFKDIFKVALPVAQAAEPFIDVALPGIGGLYNATVNAVVSAEVAATAAGAQNGSGAQKLAFVAQAIEPIAVQYFASQHIVVNQAQIEAWVNAVVATLNSIPQPTT